MLFLPLSLVALDIFSWRVSDIDTLAIREPLSIFVVNVRKTLLTFSTGKNKLLFFATEVVLFMKSTINSFPDIEVEVTEDFDLFELSRFLCIVMQILKIRLTV